MCILFLSYNQNTSGDGGNGNYELVIASNRDEFYDRPTKPASFWGSRPKIFSGLDQQPGREGGTWLGASQGGKIAALLNIYKESHLDPSLKGRGLLVPNFLTSSMHADAYINEIEIHSYEGFHLLLLERFSSRWDITHYCNKAGTAAKQYGPGTHVFSNNLIPDRPFMKANYGKMLFADIVSKYGNAHHRDELVTELMGLLSNDTRYLPQTEADMAAFTLHKEPFYSSVFVSSPDGAYGTRTNTVILIDSKGQGEVIERTRPDGGQYPWITTCVQMQFGAL